MFSCVLLFFFGVKVQALMETVQSMDSALQRRSKLRSSATTTASIGGSAPASPLTDSEKISLQLLLDVNSFIAEVFCFFCSSLFIHVQTTVVVFSKG